MRQLLVEVPVALGKRLDEASAHHGLPKGVIARKALDAYLDELSDSTQRFIAEVPQELARDFEIFRAVFYSANRSAVIASALREHIDNVLASDKRAQERFQQEQAARAPEKVVSISEVNGGVKGGRE